MITLTKKEAIIIINETNTEYEKFLGNLNRIYRLEPESLTPEATILASQYDEIYKCLNSDLWQSYKTAKSSTLDLILNEYYLLCKNFNFKTLHKYPKEEFCVSELEDKIPDVIEAALQKLEEYGDDKIQKSIKQYRSRRRVIEFTTMKENQNGETQKINDFYSHFISDRFEENTLENQIQLAITLAHEFKRNAATDSLEAETQEIVLNDTKIIESFADTYGDGLYKKYPEYGILHYIKKIFGETELKDFVNYAFDSTGNYWKVNNNGDLIDDDNVQKVFDVKGKEQPLNFQSTYNGRQGTLEKWLGISNAYSTLLKPAGYNYDGEKWTSKPGKIDHIKIEEAYKKGDLTDDQYNLIQLAAGKKEENSEENQEINFFSQFLKDYATSVQIKTQIELEFTNKAWEWIKRKIDKWFGKNETEFSKALKENEKIKEEKKWGNNESHCDEYCEAVLKSAGKLPSDWPGVNYKVSWNDNGKRKDSFMEFYRSKLKNSPEPGWNIMLMDGHTRSGTVLAPHMVVMYLREDGLIDFSHYTSDHVVEPRNGWTLKEMTETGKGTHDRFGYSNFKYLPLGK